ncbi:MAG TPA: family 1 glycosylhydrolase [Candidatus Dormibacteraeota bacterium]|nr:family 1 glycosylhydrolase [Candidatus Dormibacteraeota bacterium]
MSGERRFPQGFLWGCATAAHHVEGGNHNCDWWEFEQRGGILTGDSADPACDQYRRFPEDFGLLRRLNNNAHRLSVEWSRIEPAAGEFDLAQIEHYRQVLLELRHQGMAPMVTLHHFTSPIWFARRGGWAASGAHEGWLPFVRRVAAELGELVAFWCTLNEPNIYAYQGWLAGEFPPGRRSDVHGMYRVLANMRRGHEAAYRELGRLTPAVPVGIAQHKWLMLPANPALRRDRFAAASAQFFMDRWPAGGRWQRVFEAPCDYLGLNHYSGSLVAFSVRHAGEGFANRFNPPGLPVSDFDWPVEPRWLRVCLEQLRHLGKPVYVTENGMATIDDRRRIRFLRDVLGQVWQAIQDGVDVRGYFHFSSHDNFEWARGYSMRFGLIGVDLETQERTVKPSGRLFGRIADANALPADD